MRAIDAYELYRIEKLLDTDIVRQDRVALNLLEQVLYDIQHVPTLTPPNEWVSVEDELPARDGIYLVYTTRGSVTTAHFYAEKIFRDDYKRKASWQGNRNVTHWTPLPAPPDRRPQESQEDT